MFSRIRGYVRRISGKTSVHSVADLRTGRAQALNFGGTLAARASDVRIGRGIVRAMDGARRINRAARRIDSAHADGFGVLQIRGDDWVTTFHDGTRLLWRGE
jgi:hypothetical protein